MRADLSDVGDDLLMETVEVEGATLVVSSAGKDAWTVRRTTPRPGEKRNPTGEVQGVQRFGGVFFCACNGFYYRKKCRHLSAVKKLLGIEVSDG